MKILIFGWDIGFRPSHKVDYLGDTVYHGLKEIYGKDVSSNIAQDHMYKDYKYLDRLRGHGFTLFGTLDPKLRVVDEDFESKIKEHYYDYIIFSRVHRSLEHYELVSKYYKGSEIVFVDGGDLKSLQPHNANNPYFKRELWIDERKNLFSLGFGIPKSKFCKKKPKKTKKMAHQILPLGAGGSYKFKDEKEYYKDYQTSYYAPTSQRNGFECLRYLEIIANRCLPIIPKLHEIPKNVMKYYPKDLLRFNQDMSEEEYDELVDKVFKHAYKNLTTEAMVKRMMKQLVEFNEISK